MKKYLLASTAMAAVGLLAAGPANAQLDVQVGGYMEQWFGYGESDISGFDSFDQKNDSEIHFEGMYALDNGLQFGIDVQLEGSSEGDQIDESFMVVQGSFGRVLIGSENSAHYLMHYGVPDVGIGLNEGDANLWVPVFPAGSVYEALNSTSARALDDDSNKISYFTPRFAGFQAGASYIPEYEQDNNAQPGIPGAPPGVGDGDDRYNNAWSFGLNYDNRFGAFRVQGSLGYARAEAPDVPTAAGVDDGWLWNAGLRLSFAGFTVSGAYADINDFRSAAVSTAAAPLSAASSIDGRTWMAGVMYEFGPAGVSLGYSNGRQDGTAAAGRNEYEVWQLSGDYDLGPGVTFKASALHSDFDAETGGTSNDGWAIVGGFVLVF